MRPKLVVVGLLAAIASAGTAQARVGGTVAAFNESMLVGKLGYKLAGTQNIIAGQYKGFTAHQYVSPDLRSFIDVVVSPRGAIVEQAMLLPITPTALDAARFVEFMREATNNSVDMNEIFKFIHDSVQVAKEYRKQFGGRFVTVYRYPPSLVVMDIKVTAAPAAKKAK
jgi:hypothetical protein